MSAVESNTTGMTTKGPLTLMNSTTPSIHLANSQAQTPPPPPLPLTSTTSLPASPAPFNEDKPIEKFYKKEKQILFEFDQIVKGMSVVYY